MRVSAIFGTSVRRRWRTSSHSFKMQHTDYARLYPYTLQRRLVHVCRCLLNVCFNYNYAHRDEHRGRTSRTYMRAITHIHTRAPWETLITAPVHISGRTKHLKPIARRRCEVVWCSGVGKPKAERACLAQLIPLLWLWLVLIIIISNP